MIPITPQITGTFRKLDLMKEYNKEQFHTSSFKVSDSY